MNRKLAVTCAVAIVSLIAACSQQAGSGGGKKSDNVAVVDGLAISRNVYMEYVKSVTNTPWEKINETQRSGLLENLINAAVLARQADASGITAQDDTRAALELSRLNVLSQFVTEDFKKAHKSTDAELHAEYDELVAAMPKVQYRASHILVGSEDAARQIIAQLKAGGNFAQIARKESMDTKSREKDGDLDWFDAGSMTPPFVEALKALKKGETTATPVKTDYGWHVIRLTDTRATVPPPFNNVKDNVEELLLKKKITAHLKELLGKTKITRSL